MLKENVNESTSYKDVFPAIAKFIDDAYFAGEIQDLEKNVQEPFELLLDTDYGNSLELRRKMMQAINTIRNFTKALELFTTNQVEEACKMYTNV